MADGSDRNIDLSAVPSGWRIIMLRQSLDDSWSATLARRDLLTLGAPYVSAFKAETAQKALLLAAHETGEANDGG